MKRFLLIFALVLLSEIGQAQIGKYQNFCEYGQQPIALSGLTSTTLAQASLTSCLVTVYVHDTTTVATIYADELSTPLTNPFTAPASGLFGFYAALSSHYDVTATGQVACVPNLGSCPSSGLQTQTIAYTDINLAGGTITGVQFQTNGASNASQTVLNLVAGTNITLVNSGGAVTINSTGGSGGGVSSLTGDGTIFSNSASTGAVTLTLAHTATGSGGVVLATSPTISGLVLSGIAGTQCLHSIAGVISGTGVDCGSGGGGSGSVITVNGGTALGSPTNFTNGTNTTATNPSGNNVQINVATAGASTLGLVELNTDFGGTAAAPHVIGLNGTLLSGLATGLLKNTTSTGVPTIAAAGTDYVLPTGSISGMAANLSGTPALPNGTTATTQTTGDNTAKLATDAFVNASIAAAGTVTGSGFTSGQPMVATGVNSIANGAINFAGGSSFITGRAPAANLPTTTMYTNAAQTMASGNTLTVTPSATLAGLNLGSVTVNPSSLSGGDIWFRTDLNQIAYFDGSVTQLVMDQITPVTLAQLNDSSPVNGTILVENSGSLSPVRLGTLGCLMDAGSSAPQYDCNMQYVLGSPNTLLVAGNIQVTGQVIGGAPWTAVSGVPTSLTAPGATKSGIGFNADGNLYFNPLNAGWGEVPFIPGAAVAADQLPIGTGTGTFQADTLPNCTAATCALNYSTSTHTFGTNTAVITGTGVANSYAKFSAAGVIATATSVETSNGLQPHQNVDIQQNQFTMEATTAGGSYTAGLLACVTASSTVGNCSSGALNLTMIGVLIAKNGTTPQWATSGVTNVTSHSSASFTAGDIVCSDSSNGGDVIDNGTSVCSTGTKQVGIVYVTDSSVFSHSVILWK